MINILSLLISGDYIKPTESGVCGLEGTLMLAEGESQVKELLSCWCREDKTGALITQQNVENLCMTHCNDDSKCTGYHYFSETNPDCEFYTSLSGNESCPDGCDKWGEDPGDLMNIPDPEGTFSGCYIKKKATV